MDGRATMGLAAAETSKGSSLEDAHNGREWRRADLRDGGRRSVEGQAAQYAAWRESAATVVLRFCATDLELNDRGVWWDF